MTGKILVIDDDEGVRLTIKYVLERAHYNVSLANLPTEALEQFCEFNPDLVITDLIMPGLEGNELIAKLRELAPPLKIVAISGGARLNNSGILEQSLRMGADRFLRKPFQMGELSSVVAELLEQRENTGD